MLMFSKLPGGGCRVYDDGFMYDFDKMGECVSGPLPSDGGGSQAASYVSVVSSAGRTEVGLFIGDGMDLYITQMKPQECVMKAYGLLNPLYFLRRTGTDCGMMYNQVVFVCPETFTGGNLVKDLMLTKDGV